MTGCSCPIDITDYDTTDAFWASRPRAWEKLASLTPGARAVVINMVERFWRAVVIDVVERFWIESDAS